MNTTNNGTTTQQRILIAGAGSIGTALGVLLHTQGHNVTLFRRNRSHRSVNITMVGIVNKEVKLSIITADEFTKQHYDFVFICVQKQQTATLLEVLPKICDFTSKTIIVSFQNGINPIDAIYKNIHPQCRNASFIQAVVWWSATLSEDTNLLYHNQAPTVLGTISINGKMMSSKSDLESLKSLLKPNLEITLTKSIIAEIYKKLLLNVVSPVLALVKQPYPTGLGDQTVREIVHHIFDDVMKIGKSQGWDTNDRRLEKFHQILQGKITPVRQYDPAGLPSHKVSTQISMEKYGGKLSNAYELLKIFIELGSKACEILLNEVQQRSASYEALTIKERAHLLEKIKLHTRMTCENTR